VDAGVGHHDPHIFQGELKFERSDDFAPARHKGGSVLNEKGTIAAQLGSDCPFFVQDRPALVSGRGEVVTPLEFELPLKDVWVVVANPGIHIGTAEAFSGLAPRDRTTDWTRLAHEPLHAWKDIVQNDFEPGACERHPEVAALLTQVEEAGATYVQMTGSGSTVFGLFTEEGAARRAAQLVGAGHCGPALRTQR